ncbi:GAF domain-containing sensor histidine kinase [Streptomyces sp. NPDC056149]|uniref:GAF domain-containing sensor histidine kinase n=1 Tax=Streptomyces sp. NPDC056149 TaxID=3345728 RepID=UPI0035E34266
MAERSGRTNGLRALGHTLPQDLLERLHTVQATAGGPHHLLLEAILSVGTGLDVQQVLRQIVEAAAVVTDARYGALGVIGADGRLSQFLPVGLTDEQFAAIGALPAGHGILGELIRHSVPLRLEELGRHPASYGFPPNHPAMHTFLGVPIRVRDEIFGNLYLTEKRGGGPFTDEDETVLATLAVAAGVAVEHARLYEEAHHRQEWLEANGDIVSRLLPGAQEKDVLSTIVDHAARILSADLAVLALPIGSDRLRMEVASGVDADAHRGLVLPRRGSFSGAALDAERPLISEDIEHDPRVTAGPPRWQGLGPAVAVPMTTRARLRGVLLLARLRGRAPFTAPETTPLLTFAGQAALAMELDEQRCAAEQVTLLKDHDRIARDLHDLAIQRLFAIGMTLQSTVRFVEHPEASERLLRAVDDLDETIKIIRSTIFGLRPRDPTPGRQRLRARTVTAVEEASRALDFTPSLRMEGLLDTDVPDELAEQVLAALGEALSNVARHAHASAADVALVLRDRRLTLTVTDNGVGIPEHNNRRSGLRNLAQRAEELGGTMAVDTPEDGGTRLVWSAPVPE